MKFLQTLLIVSSSLLIPSVLSAEPAAPGAATPDIPVVKVRAIKQVTFDNWIAADGVFRINWPCLKVTLHSTANVTDKETIGRAYFFDKDRKLISKFDKIPNANHPDGGYGLPPLLKARETADVFVPIETIAKEKKWRNAVLVFGDKRKLTAEVFPRPHTSLTWKDFDFPEKEALLAQEKQEEEDTKKKK